VTHRAILFVNTFDAAAALMTRNQEHRFHALAMLQHLTFNERALGADASDLCLSVPQVAHSHEARRGIQLKATLHLCSPQGTPS
jgi:hypothetical protein